MIMHRQECFHRRALIALLALSMCSACAAGVAQAGVPPGQEADIVFRTGPHWRQALRRSSTETFSCAGSTIVIESIYGSGTPRPVARVTVNGLAVAGVERINAAIAQLGTRPAFGLRCSGEMYELDLVADSGSGPARVETVSFTAPPAPAEPR